MIFFTSCRANLAKSCALLSVLISSESFSFAALEDIAKEPINYNSAPVYDRVFRLIKKIEQGDAKLEWDNQRGWLPSILEHLNIHPSSQTLVFSKTSLQLRVITPQSPRAIYFNDDTYVGWTQFGNVIELSAVDPVQGAIFYTLPQNKMSKSKIDRDRGDCMSCHCSFKTKGVPGYLVRSVFTDGNGQPYFRFGTTTTDHTTPFSDRFGGWYVTGTHGRMRHRGNVIARDDYSNPIDPEQGANKTRLDDVIRTSSYLANGRDIVALMVLEHQSQMHNHITKASYEYRFAMHYQKVMNKALGRSSSHEIETSKNRIVSAGERLLKYLLFDDECFLEDSVEGTSVFAEHFTSLGPRDSKGRSLRDFDLKRRMFRYPCSFLIYSKTFDQLPEPILTYVERRLIEILKDEDTGTDFVHLSKKDRIAILEILMETKQGFRAKVNR